ncbi:MAG: hypothetical protein A2042_04335 [Candidatus Schekmanbacteria bacterium GWA2_38_11]|uniref:histidine kinase n=1 Tax=Candidatus Schekmanbacteria bacterium GWA2_38_11 TaxID=1817876 RepID=A0A1F7RP75_9BACT|nr:MAG: hypothetical protein A2042_04335 [Candidatus Schekmanbacteria bacterium GWA2_38_11]
MKWYIFSFFFGIFLSAASGLFVYLKDRRSPQNKILCLLCLSVTIWQVGRYMTAILIDEKEALFWCRILYIGAIFIPPLSLHFIIALLNKTQANGKLILFGYILGMTQLALNFTDLFVAKMVYKNGLGFYEVPGKLYAVFFITYSIYSFYIIYELLKEYYTISSSLKRIKIKYITIVSALGFLSGFTAFFPVFDINISPFASSLASIYLFSISYALVTFRVVDINYLFKKGIIYVCTLPLLLIPSYFVVVISQEYFFKHSDYLFSALTIGMTFLIGGVLPKYKGMTQRSIEQVLFKGEINYEETIYKLSKMIAGVLDLKLLLKIIIESLVKTMNITKASIILLDEEKGIFRIEESYGYNYESDFIPFFKDDLFFRWVKEKSEIIVKEEVEREKDNYKIETIIKKMNSIEASVCIPLIMKDRLIGVIALGRKESGDMYTDKDLDLLMTLANQGSVAIENAKIYDNLKKSKINMRRADRLASLGTLTAGLAHEIRNPLVSIKTFLQLLPERFDDEEFRTYFLNLTVDEVERICRLLNELLDFAKPTDPNFNAEDINEVIEKIVLLIENQAKKKNIVTHKNYCQDLPKIMIDKEQIKQVLLNIILNAVQATSANGEIFIETRRFNGSDEFVQVEIRDTGEGIPEKDIENIFTPFFTTKHGGSGLGLSISHRIIQEHRGSINVISQVGKGSSFFINLPLNPRNYERRKRSEAYEKESSGWQ